MKRLSADDPTRVGPYDTVALLGAGGMGTVYLAQDTDGQFVAVKVMSPRLVGDTDGRARFKREVLAASQVGGRFTARIVASDPDADSPWYASEYIPGITLQEAVEMAGGKLPPEAVQALAWGLLEALGNVHAAGITHRDLKPANIILSQNGPYVIDFGIAHIEGERGLTRTGFLVGTLDYLAPERIEGGSPQASWDIFSLGSVLVYALTGHVPFDGMPAILSKAPDLSGVPLNFRRLIERCLSKSPTNRLKLSSIEHLIPGSKTSAVDGTRHLPRPVATRILYEATEYPSGTTKRTGEPRSVGRASVPDEYIPRKNREIDKILEALARKKERRRREAVQNARAMAAAKKIRDAAKKARQEESRRAKPIPGGARVPRAPIEEASVAPVASRPRPATPKSKTAGKIGDVFLWGLGILVAISIVLGVIHHAAPGVLPKQLDDAIAKISHFSLGKSLPDTHKPSPSPSPTALGAPAVHFAPGALGKTFVQTNPGSNIAVTKVSLKGYTLTVAVKVTGYANEGDAPFSDSCARVDGLVPNKYFTSQPNSFKTSGPNLANEANTVRTGTITFNVDLPGTYSLLTECQGTDVAQASVLGRATIDGFVGVLSNTVGFMAVLKQQRRGSDLIVIMPSYNKVDFNKFCLKTSGGPQVVTKAEKFGQNGFGYMRLHFRNALAGPTLYTSCSGSTYNGTGLPLQ